MRVSLCHRQISPNPIHGLRSWLATLAQIEHEPRILHGFTAKTSGGNLLNRKEFLDFA